MESYPGELLVGVFPLVFCVDATLEKKEERNRTQFDKFLDTISITSSMVDGGGDIHEGGPMMQRVEEEQSDQEDDLLLNQSGGIEMPVRRKSSRANSDSSSAPGSPAPSRRTKNKPLIANRSPFSKRMSPKSTKAGKRISNDAKAGTDSSGAPRIDLGIEVPPSFSEALKQGQSFFQRARIVSSSPRHGFPPSKDPTGALNRVVAITGLKPGELPPRNPTPHQKKLLKKRAVAKLKSAVQARPIDGILPSGWLEKHAAALPSVIVVVTQVHPPQTQVQQRQDELLLEAIENLQHSLAPKRKVDIKVVAVIQEGVSPIMADQWSQGMLGRFPTFLKVDPKMYLSGDPECVLTLVEERELKSMDEADILPAHLNNPKTSPLPGLHQSIHRSSVRYYKKRSREIKQKLLRLRGFQGVTSRSPALMPLLIRYCFKAAVFYEFQWKQDKSLKYLVEAYRLVETYYNYLLFWKHQREIGALGDYGEEEDRQQQQSGEMKLSESTKEELQIPVLESSDELEAGGGVEMSLPGTASTASRSSSSSDDIVDSMPPVVADDMIHQCRAIADWLNFKILQMCMVCQDKSGTITASVQWQRHAKTFCCPRRSFLHTPTAPWLDWSYVAQQKVVVSQLMERYPPRALGNLGDTSKNNDSYDEDLLRCSPWRAHEAAAEALLKAGHRVRAVEEKGGLSSLPPPGKEGETTRIRYVGGIDHEGYRPSFAEESKKTHLEEALNCALRGISLYEQEIGALDAAKVLLPWTRSGARLYYLAGGALLGLDKHADAISHLEKAAQLCKGWSKLESVVGRLLIECYKQQDNLMGPVKDEDGSRGDRTSFLLESYFNARLSNDNLATALDKLMGMDGVDLVGGEGGDDRFLKWHCDFLDSDTLESPTPPFSFAIAFPSSTHGTSGNTVKAGVWIKSNLHNTIRVHRLSVISLLGPLAVRSQDFPTNEAAVTIQPNEAVAFDTELLLPVDVAKNIVDGEDTNAATGNPPAGKSLTSKPRSGGFTAAGGSQYSEIEDDADKAAGPVPWNIRCLGGKPLRCEGMIVTFSVVSSSPSDTLVKLAVEARYPDAPPNTRRTNFDENNYVSSAWKQPQSFLNVRGPRCMRLLPPVSDMTVTNVTEAVTNGTALEGTVNRVVLKLKAGANESCTDLVIRVKSSSVLTTPNGKEKPISLPDGETSSEEVEDMMNPRVRAPVLVKPDSSSKTFMTDFGYILPSGWALACGGHGGDDDFGMSAPTIKAGEETYVSFDVYRPSCEPVESNTKGNQAILDEMTKLNDCKCETKIDVSIQYNQKLIDGNDKPDNSVSLDHSVDVVWKSPMAVAFSSNTKAAYPSGYQHPSNIVPFNFASDNAAAKPDPSKETILIDGGRVFTKGILDPIASTDGLKIEIDKIQYTDAESEVTNCKFELLSGVDADGTIFQGQANHPSRTLCTGSQMSFAWMTKVSMGENHSEEPLTAPIGTVSIHWQPSPIELSEGAPFMKTDDFSWRHGPLQLEKPAVCRFSGPLCRIESAPFEVVPENLPDSIKVASPIEVTYQIRNKTPIDQELEMICQNGASGGEEAANNGFLVGGLVTRKTSLGPFESHSFSYTTVPTKVGKVHLPSISITSLRYNTWIIRESLERRSIFVLP